MTTQRNKKKEFIHYCYSSRGRVQYRRSDIYITNYKEITKIMRAAETSITAHKLVQEDQTH